jgi:hypothetical protein
LARPRTSLLVIAAFTACAPLFAAPPRSVAEIPLFPGASTDPAAQARDQGKAESGLLSLEQASYLSEASAEEIFAYYRDALGAAAWKQPASPPPMNPGSSMPPAWHLNPYQGSDFSSGHDGQGRMTYDGEWIRKILREKRKPIEGAYVSQASIVWSFVDEDGRNHVLAVEIADHSFDAYRGFDKSPGALPQGKQVYRPRAAIAFRCAVQASRQEKDAARSAAADQASADVSSKAQAMAVNPPTAAELGVPLYPGAAFHPDISAGMSMGNGAKAWIFSTEDDPAAVSAFYAKATGKAPSALGKATRIVLKGAGPFPQHFIVIEPNKSVKGGGKFLIEVFRSPE